MALLDRLLTSPIDVPQIQYGPILHSFPDKASSRFFHTAPAFDAPVRVPVVILS